MPESGGFGRLVLGRPPHPDEPGYRGNARLYLQELARWLTRMADELQLSSEIERRLLTAVTSVFGRTGDVVAAAGDYDASEIDNDSGVSGATVKAALDALAALVVARLPLAGGSMTGGINLADNALTRPNITDYAVESTSPSSVSGTLTLAQTNGNDFSVTLTENVTTITVTGWGPSGTLSKFSLALTQDGTGGRTVAFPAGWNWPGGAAPTMSSGANDHDEFVVWSRDEGTTVYAAVVGQDFT